MPFRTLHSKIFVLVTGTLITIAIVVMLTSQRNVTDTVMSSEHHAIRNVMSLIQHDAASRWSAMLNNKISVVRNGRRQLMQTGDVIAATLESYAHLADDGIVTEKIAQTLARGWINDLHLDDDRYAFIFDAQHRVLASGLPGMIGHDLSELRDFKNRPLAQSVLDESRDSGYSFAIYRRPGSPRASIRSSNEPTELSDDKTRYAYFGYFRPWNWVFAVSDSTAAVISQIEAHRAQMEQSLRETLSPLRLAHSGFVFIVADDGRMVVPPPDTHTSLLNGLFNNGQPFRQRLTESAQTDFQMLRIDGAQGPWQVGRVRFSPLQWTIYSVVPEGDLTAPARELLRNQAVIFGAMLVIALFCAWLLAARIVRPLKTLTRFAHQLPEQALHAEDRFPIHIAALPERYQDEVGRLAAAFLYMDGKLRENITRLMKETVARERFESELNIARAIQLGLLPIPLSRVAQERVDLHALMRPAKQVGGDLYDYFILSNGKLCVVIGDVSDKGVPAALFMAITRTLIRATAEDEVDPARIVHKVNDRLAENNPNVMFVTLLVGVLDMATGELIWVNAGHLAPMVIDACGAVRTLAGRSGPACGVQENMPYRTYAAQLQIGETFIAYTDGVTECVNRCNEQYGNDRLVETLTHPTTSTERLTERLVRDVDTFAAGAEQIDDITLLALCRK
ncbi:SpoIIE family protein phosphatase [Bordetella tumulicola]